MVSPLRVLVVDDDDYVRRIISHSLSHAGYEVEEASGAALGIYLASIRPPDTLVVDLYMPGVSGLEMLRALRVTDWFDGCAVVVASGIYNHDNDEVAEAVNRFGAVFLQKPFQREDLLSAIGTALDSARTPSWWQDKAATISAETVCRDRVGETPET